jgi:hypothetical protein
MMSRLLAVFAVGLWPSVTLAQAAADSTAVLRAVGAALRAERVRAVAARFACDVRAGPCEREAHRHWNSVARGERLLRALAEAADAPVVAPASAAPPPCPWGGQRSSGAGYLVAVPPPRFRRDTAEVTVLKSCDNPPGYVHDVFARDDVYVVVHEGGVWRVSRTYLSRIT